MVDKLMTKSALSATLQKLIVEPCRVRVMVFNTTFNNISAYRGSQFHWWRKPEYQMKTTDLLQVTD